MKKLSYLLYPVQLIYFVAKITCYAINNDSPWPMTILWGALSNFSIELTKARNVIQSQKTFS